MPFLEKAPVVLPPPVHTPFATNSDMFMPGVFIVFRKSSLYRLHPSFKPYEWEENVLMVY